MIERIIHCQGPDCQTHIRTATPPPYIPRGFIFVQEGKSVGSHESHFCSWDCILKFAAKLEPPEVIEWNSPQ